MKYWTEQSILYISHLINKVKLRDEIYRNKLINGNNIVKYFEETTSFFDIKTVFYSIIK